MGIETASYIDELDDSYPVGATDPKSGGDDHIRLIKTVLQNSFPNVSGEVSASDVELSYVTGVTSAIQTQLSNHLVLIAAKATKGKTLVSSNDTTEGYLNGKLVAGENITLTENNNGSNETLSIALGEQILLVEQRETAGSGGGNAGATTWNDRALNTVVKNSISGASLLGGTITLPAGTYEVVGWGCAYDTGSHMTKLYNDTGAADLTDLQGNEVLGSAEESHYAAPGGYASGGPTKSHMQAYFTLAGAKDIIVKHYTELAVATNGLGRPLNIGYDELYASYCFRKIA